MSTSRQPSLVDEFPPTIRARGEEYFRAGRVHVIRSGPTQLVASVQGTRPYTVHIGRASRGPLTLTCSCPYFDEWLAPCKHLWAALLEAERSRSAVLEGITLEGRTAPRSTWREALTRVQPSPAPARPQENAWSERRRIAYLVDVDDAEPGYAPGLQVRLATQVRTRGDEWGAPRRFAHSLAQWLAAPDPDDREIAQLLLGSRQWDAYGLTLRGSMRAETVFRIAPPAFPVTLRRMCATGRCVVRTGERTVPLRWDDAAWTLCLTLVPGARALRLDGVLARDAAHVALTAPLALLEGLAITGTGEEAVAAPVQDGGAVALVRALRGGMHLDVPPGEAVELARDLATRFPRLAPLQLPDTTGVQMVRVPPVPHLALHVTPARAGTLPGAGAMAEARLRFAYEELHVDAGVPGATIASADGRTLAWRDADAERAALRRLGTFFHRERDAVTGMPRLRAPLGRAATVAVELAREGWVVTLDDRPLRQAGAAALRVRSGTDWFDLELAADFEGVSASVPELLSALRRGERTLRLSDGSVGALPEEWVARYGGLATLGAPAADVLRFGRSQALLLDALLAAVPAVEVDEAFAHTRATLREFCGAVPLDAPGDFRGALRPYQREGLGWLDALRRLGIGGVLADDMGLGKTVQALALIVMRRDAGAGPSLVVVPRSLVFNWVDEAARFAPSLRVLVHHGAGRRRDGAGFDDANLVLTTYGTLRRDATTLAAQEFDHLILDEAQAIKNAGSETARAARALRARHRLAMSGTPIENRLAELWSLFEFLNPGMLGAAPAFRRLTTAGLVSEGTAADERLVAEARASVARAVGPFVLRRTKAQVASDLPARTEQTLWVELGREERRRYDELRNHYRAALLDRVAREGMRGARMHVLEALLRLRQAACHPGLLDPGRAAESSSKLEVLLARLAETTAEGHKTIVFSQFTTLLGIVRTRVDALGIGYEYLDGKTRDRRRRVERFQADPAIPLFLVSLKAGGVGLNLTAADTVLLLDPWWNPATEAQAIDRAHRIGQTRPVLALRLVARDTVEEKVVALQERKRALADAIIRADERGAARLTRDELEEILQ